MGVELKLKPSTLGPDTLHPGLEDTYYIDTSCLLYMYTVHVTLRHVEEILKDVREAVQQAPS